MSVKEVLPFGGGELGPASRVFGWRRVRSVRSFNSVDIGSSWLRYRHMAQSSEDLGDLLETVLACDNMEL